MIYLASPDNQLQANSARGKPILASFALVEKKKGLYEQYLPSFSRVLIDSGAYSELNSNVSVDLCAYIDWAQSIPWADAWAGLDDIRGDWKRSLENYKAGGFPTYHDTDPPELLPNLVELARERGGWLGIGMLPPRTNRAHWLRETLEQVPDDLHIHGWALVAYASESRIDSMDSTHWWREAMKYRRDFPWLTYGECLEISIKKVERLHRVVAVPDIQMTIEETT